MTVKILYGSETGNAEGLAYDAKKNLDSHNLKSEVINMADVSIDDLINYEKMIIITSTWGDGEPPTNAESLYNKLENNTNMEFPDLKYSIFAIGQAFYENFCKTGIDFDKFLENHKAKRILPVEMSDDDFSDKFPDWLEKVRESL